MTKIKSVCKRNKKRYLFLVYDVGLVQLHAWCPGNGLQANSEYAIQFSFAETVVVFGYMEAFQVIRHATEKS